MIIDYTFIVQRAPVPWTPDMMHDLIDGVNKFGYRWKKIKKEYNFTVAESTLIRK